MEGFLTTFFLTVFSLEVSIFTQITQPRFIWRSTGWSYSFGFPNAQAKTFRYLIWLDESTRCCAYMCAKLYGARSCICPCSSLNAIWKESFKSTSPRTLPSLAIAIVPRFFVLELRSSNVFSPCNIFIAHGFFTNKAHVGAMGLSNRKSTGLGFKMDCWKCFVTAMSMPLKRETRCFDEAINLRTRRFSKQVLQTSEPLELWAFNGVGKTLNAYLVKHGLNMSGRSDLLLIPGRIRYYMLHPKSQQSVLETVSTLNAYLATGRENQWSYESSFPCEKI